MIAVGLNVGGVQFDRMLQVTQRLLAAVHIAQCQRPVVEGFGKSGRQVYGSVQTFECFVKSFQIAQDQTAIIMRSRVIGFQGDRTLEAGQRLVTVCRYRAVQA